MRFILHSHPDMACGPETNVAHAFAKPVRHDRPDVRALPGAAHEEAVVRQVAGRPSARRADDAHVPRGRFICLCWHCMDVIASGVEATPWGLPEDGAGTQHRGAGIQDRPRERRPERPEDPVYPRDQLWVRGARGLGARRCGPSPPRPHRQRAKRDGQGREVIIAADPRRGSASSRAAPTWSPS
jgi:hypothetical protein